MLKDYFACFSPEFCAFFCLFDNVATHYGSENIDSVVLCGKWTLMDFSGQSTGVHPNIQVVFSGL